MRFAEVGQKFLVATESHWFSWRFLILSGVITVNVCWYIYELDNRSLRFLMKLLSIKDNMQLTGVSAAISNINRKLDCCFHSVCSSFSALVDHITNLFYISAGLIESWENGFILNRFLFCTMGLRNTMDIDRFFFTANK